MPSATPTPIAARSTASPRKRRTVSGKSPGISVKLTALHPRYEFTHQDEAVAAVLPVVRELALKASKADVHFTIDAEEADRLELQLDVFEALLADDELFANGWGGFGIAIQAYQKRAAPLCDWVVEAARAHGRKLMVRLVKGAYWDTEIKAAQVGGLPDYPVFTRKVATDVSYLACAKKLLAAERRHLSRLRDPQRQHHRPGQGAGARQAVRIPAPARHGRGTVRGAGRLEKAYRRRADAGAHLRAGRKPQGAAGLSRSPPARERRQLSFVNRIADEQVSVDELVSDPVAELDALEPKRNPEDHPSARRLRRERHNSAGVDLSDPLVREPLLERLKALESRSWAARPAHREGRGQGDHVAPRPPDHGRNGVRSERGRRRPDGPRRPCRASRIGTRLAARRGPGCSNAPPTSTRSMREEFFSLCIREAGKTLIDAVLEVREAVDFLRFYASEARRQFTKPMPLPGPTGRAERASAAWPRGVREHFAVEFPARDLHRPDLRRRSPQAMP